MTQCGRSDAHGIMICVVPADLFQTERQKSDLLQAKMSLLSDELEDTTARMQEYQAEVRSCID